MVWLTGAEHSPEAGLVKVGFTGGGTGGTCSAELAAISGGRMVVLLPTPLL